MGGGGGGPWLGGWSLLPRPPPAALAAPSPEDLSSWDSQGVGPPRPEPIFLLEKCLGEQRAPGAPGRRPAPCPGLFLGVPFLDRISPERSGSPGVGSRPRHVCLCSRVTPHEQPPVPRANRLLCVVSTVAPVALANADRGNRAPRVLARSRVINITTCRPEGLGALAVAPGASRPWPVPPRRWLFL